MASKKEKSGDGRAAGFARLLIFVVLPSALGALMTLLLVRWDSSEEVAPERLVEVYRTHGCHCAIAWIRAIEAAGYEVHEYEPESLYTVWYKLGVPERLRSCHVASYLGYFIEGHIPVAAMQRLRMERPDVRGVAVSREVDSIQHEGRDNVSQELLLYDEGGRRKRWTYSAPQNLIES